MKNLARKIDLNKATLDDIAADVRQCDQNMASNAWRIAEDLATAKDMCEEGSVSWADWLEGDVGYAKRTGDQYVQIFNSLGDTGAQLVEKGCSFNTLKALSLQKLDKKTKNKLVKRLKAKSRITEKDGAKVQVEVKEEVASTLLPPTPLPNRPEFKERLAHVRSSGASAQYLFDLHATACPETANILIKYWLQKHHPDKGGNTDDFALINTKAEEINRG
jgi:hypothetical protein